MAGSVVLRTSAVALVGMAMGALLSCTRGESAPHSVTAATPVLATTTSWGSFYVRIAPQPNPVPLNQIFAVMITVSPANDHAMAAAGTTVAVDARMPAHNHGMNLRPQVTPAGDGAFRADGLLFHMPGTWELYVDVTRADEMERATFVVDVG